MLKHTKKAPNVSVEKKNVRSEKIHEKGRKGMQHFFLERMHFSAHLCW